MNLKGVIMTLGMVIAKLVVRKLKYKLNESLAAKCGEKTRETRQFNRNSLLMGYFTVNQNDIKSHPAIFRSVVYTCTTPISS